MISGSQAMVECLKQEGVSLIFGYPGATIAPFYNSLADANIRHVLTRTEQGAGHAASGYARMTGRPGVCVSTSGPGATNLFTAIATAYSDSIPLVAITGQVATYQLGRDVFQEVDTTGAVEPFTKHSYLLKSSGDIGRVFKEAFYIASTGRKGPVLIDIPINIQQELVDFSYPNSVNIRGYKPRFDGNARQVRKVAEAVSAAARPLLCIGGGVFLSGAEKEIREFCEKTSIPAVSTMMGISALPPGHPQYYGMLGSSGVKTANVAVEESDLLMMVGVRAGDRAITRPSNLENDTTVIHIDIDSAEIGKNLGTPIPLVGDAAKVLSQLMEFDINGDWTSWISRLDAQRGQERQAMENRPEENGFVDPNRFVRNLCARLPEGSVYVADVGQNQIWSARNFSAQGRIFTTGGMGTMGYSIPAAIGTKLACPDKLVVAVCGDGSFQMSFNELATMRQHGACVKIVVMRNGVLGMVRELQHRGFSREYAVDLTGSPDFGLIAAAYGMEYDRVGTTKEADKAVQRMLEATEPYLLECIIDPKEGTF